MLRLARGGDQTKNEESMELDNYAWDDVNNLELPLEAVREARTEEMSYIRGKTFKVVNRAEAFEKTGKPPISTKWVDTDMKICFVRPHPWNVKAPALGTGDEEERRQREEDHAH